MIKLLGFAPDTDVTTQGALMDCENMVPTLTGMAGAPSLQTPSGVPALAAACHGAAVMTKLDGTRRFIAGTTDALYELSSGSWSDVTRASAYTGGTDSIWSFAQFGDATLVSNKADTIQRSTSGAFDDISGAPKAEILFTVGAFVMALNVNDGATKPNGWHCCAAYDETDWTEATATQCASGQLVSTPGYLTAGGRLGQYAVAYKSRAIYLGQYVAGAVVWDWELFPSGNAGCVGKGAWCDIDGRHFIVGEDNFWIFDGASISPVADGVVREWFSTDCSSTYKYKVTCAYDKITNLVWIFYPSEGSATIDSALVYHVLSKKFGRVAIAAEAVLEYYTASTTINGLASIASTIDALPDINFDSAYWLAGGRSMAVFNTSHQMQSLTGVSASSSFTTGDIGDDYEISSINEIRLRYATAPSSSMVQMYRKTHSGTVATPGNSGSQINGKFDIRQTARWHSAKFTFNGNVEIVGMNANPVKAGTR